ncbi:MAG: hypothetical protein HKO53_14210 [Gemmatimonadetes bacterium]|nr:hypothetical protein [Gemmatimonadota bacterium]
MMRTKLNLAVVTLTLIAMSVVAGVAGAQVDMPEADESMEGAREDLGAGLFQIVRIELALFGGLMSGDDYLNLPDILNEDLTFDTGAVEIVDFSGQSQTELRAPLKYIEDGKTLGGTATFYLGPKFGMQLSGSWTTASAVLTGHPRNNPQRFVADRTDIDIIAFGGNIIYNLGKERKWRGLRPFVNLGFGGVLNKFPKVDDVGAVFFQYGGGFSYPVYRNFRVELGANWKLYTFDTDEVARDSTVQFPALTFGFAWRYDVPEDDDVIVPDEAASDAEADLGG